MVERYEHPQRLHLDLSSKKWIQQHYRPVDDEDIEPGAAGQRGLQALADPARHAHAADFPESGWLPARVPGDVRTTLVERGILPDPNCGRNCEYGGWVEGEEWWYRCHFRLPEKIHPGGRRIQLCIDGLTSPAAFWLNGEEIGAANDPERRYRFDLPVQHSGFD